MAVSKKVKMRFERRRNRSKRSTRNHPHRYRLVVFRSARHIYGQIIDDAKAHTLVASSSLDKEVIKQLDSTTSKVECSKIVGKTLAQKALKHAIKDVCFDRNGFIYHGRVQAFADGVREGGLVF